MAPQTLNLVVGQGTSYERSIIQRHQLVLDEELAPNSAPQTSIKIQAMAIGLPAGQVLAFPHPDGTHKKIILTLATGVLPGATTAPIQPYTGTQVLSYGSMAPTLPRDITGQVWSGAVKADYRGDKLLDFSFAISPLDGLVVMSLSDVAMAAIAANCKYDQLPKDPKDWQDESKFDAKIWARGYYWDAEYRIGGKTTRALQGRFFVPAEATT